MTSRKKDKLKIPIELQDRIEKIVSRILYDEKSVKSSRLLMEKVLERVTKERITISDKMINSIIQ
jgi:chorismate mutase